MSGGGKIEFGNGEKLGLRFLQIEQDNEGECSGTCGGEGAITETGEERRLFGEAGERDNAGGKAKGCFGGGGVR